MQNKAQAQTESKSHEDQLKELITKVDQVIEQLKTKRQKKAANQ